MKTKMKDNEIIKVLECCETDFTNVYLWDDLKDKVITIPLNDIRDLINRQKAEIEILKNAVDLQKIALENQERFFKTEAIKEFAERLKELKHECGCNYRKKPVYAVTAERIDNLVNEMTEGNENA